MLRNTCFALGLSVALVLTGSGRAADEPKKPLVKPPSGEKPGEKPGVREGGPFQEVLEKLNLTDEQKEKAKGIMKDMMEKRQAIYQKVKDGGDKAQAREEMQKLHGEMAEKIKGILTDEQKKQMEELGNKRPMKPEGKPGQPPVKPEGKPGERPVKPEGKPGERGGPSGFFPPGAEEQLKLTPEQKEKIARLKQEMEGKVREMLTDEQKQKLEQMRKEPGKRPGLPGVPVRKPPEGKPGEGKPPEGKPKPPEGKPGEGKPPEGKPKPPEEKSTNPFLPGK